MKTKLMAAIAVLGLLSACSSSKKTVAETNESKQVEMTPVLLQGKLLYENNCGKCHTLHSPDKYTKEQWEPIVARMQPKAKISDEQRILVYNYLVMNK